MAQAELNIGLLGHVDHGKTSVTKCLTGTWTDTHSEELKRGITIRLGYADAVFRKCPKCPAPKCFTIEEKCPECGKATEVLRRVSFIDAPGHETLMATAISASSIMDGALLIIAANEPCPQAQTIEHLMVLDLLGVKKIVIVQNKVDLVSPEKAKEHYDQIKEFVKGTVAEGAPIVPTVANFCCNMDAVMQAIEEHLPTPKRDKKAKPKMYVARSFDINKPGTKIDKILGGVIGGSLIKGTIKVGDKIDLSPGFKREERGKEFYEPVLLTVESLNAGSEKLKEAGPGGLIAIGTKLDPSITKSDGLVGNLVGLHGTVPEPLYSLTLEFTLFERANFENPPLKMNEPLVLGVGTATTVGFVQKIKKNRVNLNLKRPVVLEENERVSISRRIGQRWRLSGYGTLSEKSA